MKHIDYFKLLIQSRSTTELIKRVLELSFSYPLYAISSIFHRKDNRWIFGTNVGFTDNAKYLFLAVSRHSDIDACWISERSQVVQQIQSMGLKAYHKYSLHGLWYCLTAKYYIFTYHSKDINFFTSKRAKKINLWHGVGIKKGSNDINKAMPSWVSRILFPHLYEHIDMFLSTSQMMDDHFEKMFHLLPEQIYQGMYPRCSFLMQPKENIMQHIQQYETSSIQNLINRIQKASKVYIYMPTWRAGQSDSFLEHSGINLLQLEQLMEEQNALFLFKLHPAIRSAHFSNKHDHIIFVDKDIDIYSILPFTSVLITDYSSIYYDYLLMENKDIILFPYDIENYKKHSDELAFDYDIYTPGTRVYTFEELIQCIRGNIPILKERHWVLNQFWGDYLYKQDTEILINKIQSL